MGNSNKKSSRILVVGLDNSGKSTIINTLKPEKEKKSDVAATVGFQVEKFKHGSVNFTMFDMSGQGRYRSLWEKYFSECEGIIFVIDSADALRLCVVKDELDVLLSNDIMKKKSDVPLLFFSNKSDLPKSMTAAQISEALELPKIEERPWNIVATNAIQGTGVEEGVKWLEQRLPDAKK